MGRLKDYTPKNQPINFLSLEWLPTAYCLRWIENRGWIVSQDDVSITVLSPLGSNDRFEQKKVRLYGDDRKRMMFDKDRLNSEIVKEQEPDIFHLWEEVYDQTHKDLITLKTKKN